MVEFVSTPPVAHPTVEASFVQTIDMTDGAANIGQAIWSAPELGDGVVQLLTLRIDPAHRRRQLGTKLLAAVIAEARAHCAGRGIKLRQLWCGIEQKTQVQARAFLMHNNFHHVATLPDLLKGQDMLIYKKSLR